MKIPHNCILYHKTCYLLYAFGSSVMRVQRSDFRDLAIEYLRHIQINRIYLRLIVNREAKREEYTICTCYE